jgi:MFS family permease
MGSLRAFVGRVVAWTGTRHARVSCFYAYGFFLLGAAIASIGPALDELARRSGHTVSEGVSGILVTSRSVGYLGASLLGGVLLDRKPLLGNWLICGGLLCCAVGFVLLTQVTQFVLMCCLMAFTGFSMGQLDVCANVLMVSE